MSVALSPAVPTALSGISDAPAELEQIYEPRIGCSKPDQAPTSEDQENYEPWTIQSHGNGRRLKKVEFSTAFYGRLPDGSPAFGAQYDGQSMQHRHADLQEDHSSPNIQTVPNSPAVGGQRPAVQDNKVGEQGTEHAGLKRRRSPDNVSGPSEKAEVIKTERPRKRANLQRSHHRRSRQSGKRNRPGQGARQ